MDHIFCKGLAVYLNTIHKISKSVAYDIASQIKPTDLNSLFSIDLSYYLSKQTIDDIKNETGNYPLKPTSFLFGLDFSLSATKLILEYYDKSDSIINLITKNN